jgi:hypothetical protein
MMVDLSSDTATRPTPAMRAFMADAPVGDDQRREDPTVNALEDEGARLLGKRGALFLPSATMANQIALKVHTQPGDEIICHEHAHIRLYEGGGPAVLSGCLLCPLPGARGVFGPEAVRAAVRPADPHFPRTRLVSIENTHNAAGGTVWTPAEVAAVASCAREHGLALHLDGSRLLNAAVRLDLPARELAAPFDTGDAVFEQGVGRAGRARCWPPTIRTCSRAPGAGSTCSAARCVRPGSWRPAACSRCGITSRGSATITGGRPAWPKGWPPLPACGSTRRPRPMSSTSMWLEPD